MDKIFSRGIMKGMEHKNPVNLSELLASQPLKKMVTQFIISVSIFSLVFSWSHHLPLIYYYEKLYYFSWKSLQLLSIAMNKNCVFLICNGILVFLAKTSALVRSPSSFDLNDMLQKRLGDGLQIETEPEPLSEKPVMSLEENGGSTQQHEEEEEEDDDMKSNEEEEEEEDTTTTKEAEEFECSNERAEEVSISIAESDEEGGFGVHEDVENEPKNCWLFYDDDDGGEDEQIYVGQEEEEEEEEEDETEKLSAEELNQKFEDFIRRMKEEFRIGEARQQLIMVN